MAHAISAARPWWVIHTGNVPPPLGHRHTARSDEWNRRTSRTARSTSAFDRVGAGGHRRLRDPCRREVAEVQDVTPCRPVRRSACPHRRGRDPHDAPAKQVRNVPPRPSRDHSTDVPRRRWRTRPSQLCTVDDDRGAMPGALTETGHPRVPASTWEMSTRLVDESPADGVVEWEAAELDQRGGKDERPHEVRVRRSVPQLVDDQRDPVGDESVVLPGLVEDARHDRGDLGAGDRAEVSGGPPTGRELEPPDRLADARQAHPPVEAAGKSDRAQPARGCPRGWGVRRIVDVVTPAVPGLAVGPGDVGRQVSDQGVADPTGEVARRARDVRTAVAGRRRSGPATQADRRRRAPGRARRGDRRRAAACRSPSARRRSG